MSILVQLPLEVLLDHILPLLSLSDLSHLRATCRFLQTLCDDDTFWKRKIHTDFNFPCDNTARRSGWKIIYRGLRSPGVYVWGETNNGRLGTARIPRSRSIPRGSAPWPLRLPINDIGACIVSLSAAGMSFFALGSEGQLYVWGTLDPRSFAQPSNQWSSPAAQVREPMKLALPTATRAISCGRTHATTLDSESYVWTFLSFGSPLRLLTPFLDTRSPETSPHQVASGWRFSATLTKSGAVYVWFPFSDMARTIQQYMNNEEERVKAQDNIIICMARDFHSDPHRLSDLPSLPLLTTNTSTKDTYLIKIAALSSELVGLTNQGHVLKIHVGDSLSTLGTWEYLPQFSESEKIKARFSTAVPDLQLPNHIQISHISAQFKTFVGYSTGPSSVVLIGIERATATTFPNIIPTLQNRNVISVVIGDYHYGALTATGNLLTWGEFSHGALGLGNPTDIPLGEPGGYADQRHLAAARDGHQFIDPPPTVKEPTKVRFDHDGKSGERFCFSVTAAGWHMGALVINLESEEDDELQMPGSFPREQESPPDSTPEVPALPAHRGLSIFRIGFPGRGGGQRLAPRGRGS